ncbi:hypothetical protein ACMXYO_06350 [Neptuniibacter sp. QD37_6]|uniref:hypothetical protein n=1 Tax=Neptuniibacter sp. QD37_6 TaxID=3398210 RepID=UPI0039F5670B
MGSGRGKYYRFTRSVTTDQVPSVDLRYLKKEGVFDAGGKGILSWSLAGADVGQVAYHCDLSGITLRYGDQSDVKEQRLSFDHTPCHYGGYRKWFLCPGCHSRSLVMYLKDGCFACRSCHHLSYRSSNETKYGRLLLKKHRLGRLLFDDYESGFGFTKTKNMHWSTFERLLPEYQALCDQLG